MVLRALYIRMSIKAFYVCSLSLHTNTQPSAKVHGMKLVLVSMVGIGGNECLGLYDNAKTQKNSTQTYEILMLVLILFIIVY